MFANAAFRYFILISWRDLISMLVYQILVKILRWQSEILQYKAVFLRQKLPRDWTNLGGNYRWVCFHCRGLCQAWNTRGEATWPSVLSVFLRAPRPSNKTCFWVHNNVDFNSSKVAIKVIQPPSQITSIGKIYKLPAVTINKSNKNWNSSTQLISQVASASSTQKF